MKAVKGYDKDYYRQTAPVVMEFEDIAQAAEYIAKKYGQPVEDMTHSIMNETNCDAIYFDDGTVILLEFT